ncbi:hypothetical protein PHJA_000549800 [Phtheirospermum japonicum]|uniref:Uncharacterized protein n=1 Tax=Phtheirospermum japonicum TaxID=374723 RepID=A0A830BD65_9LAMI|nr:hypothetical protein PHJA_000549800 [Phtheirospermum japonicum]
MKTTELSEEQTHINKRMKKEPSVLEERASTSKVLNFPDEPLVDDKHLGDDVMSIDTVEDKNDDEMSTSTEEVGTLRGLINEFATEDRVKKHEAWMAWVKEDPVLGTDLEDDADPDALTIDYTVENMLDEEGLRKQIDACMGNHGKAEREVAFKKIRAEQLRCGRSLPEGVVVRWLVSYNPLTRFVPYSMVAVTKPA